MERYPGKLNAPPVLVGAGVYLLFIIYKVLYQKSNIPFKKMKPREETLL